MTTKLSDEMLADDAKGASQIPLDAAGELLTHNGVNLVELVPGAAGRYLKSAGVGAPLEWDVPPQVSDVGDVKWSAKTTATTGWTKCDGSAISRTTYAALLSAITHNRNGDISNGTPNVTNLSTTADLRAGMPVEGTGIQTGTRIASITGSTTLTLTKNATATGTQALRFFPCGNGDGSTTFNVPDLRGRVAVGEGTASKDIAISALSAGADTLTVLYNEVLQTGQIVVYSGSGITNLTSTHRYGVIRVDETTIKLVGPSSTNLADDDNRTANAVAGTSIRDIAGTPGASDKVTISLSQRNYGDTLGEESHALLVTELPAHTHTYDDEGAIVGSDVGSFGKNDFADTSRTSGSTGSSVWHNTMPPVFALYCYIYHGVI